MATVKQTGIGKFEVTAEGKMGHTWVEMKDTTRRDAEAFARQAQRIMDDKQWQPRDFMKIGVIIGLIVILLMWGL